MRFGKQPAALLLGMLIWASLLPASTAQSSDVATVLQQIIASSHLTGIRWPNFSDVQSDVSSVYAQNGHALLWIVNGTVTAKGESVLDALRTSAAKGLNPEDYDGAELTDWANRLHNSGAVTGETAALDLAITIDLMRYASALHQGRVDPRRVHFAIRPKDRLDAAAIVREYLLPDKSLPEVLTQIEPPFRGYRDTLVALVRIQQQAAKESPKIPAKPRLPLRRGQSYSDVDALAARLVFLQDLDPSSPYQHSLGAYDGPIVEAVKHLQSRHGLDPNGTLDVSTWRALTTPLSVRVEQLQLTLERWRWLPSTVRPAIVVNIPEFELRAFDDKGQIALRMHVIVGKAYRHKTPIFEDSLEAVVVRPWWNVPLNIQRNEMVPQLRSDLDYMQKNKLEVVSDKGLSISLPPQQELISGLQSGEFRLRQEPGPANSLGLLKFDFPNEYSVYMHGTPARQLFSQVRRDFSHGCIRVQDPDALAQWVLRNDPGWNKAKLAEACNGERTIRISVSPPITVLVLYGTAVVEENGEVHFFDDLYGYDAELKKTLRLGYPYEAKLRIGTTPTSKAVTMNASH